LIERFGWDCLVSDYGQFGVSAVRHVAGSLRKQRRLIAAGIQI